MLRVERPRMKMAQGAKDFVPANAARIYPVLIHEVLHHCHGGRHHIFQVIVEGHALLQQPSNPA